MNLIYRNQWTSVPGTLSYASASIDYNVPQFGGGIGLLISKGSEGTAYLDRTNIAGCYSYSIGSEDFVLSFGLQAGITNRKIDLNKLIFDDQIDPTLGIITGSSAAAAANFPFNNKFYFDAGIGTNLAVGEFNLGAALQHINRPNESFTGVTAKLPMRINAHVSYRLDLNRFENMDEEEKSYIIPSVVFYKQSQAESYSIGLQYKHKSINLGLSYRSGASTGPTAIVLSLIFDLPINTAGGEKVRFGISHDAQLQGLTYGNTSGSTEGSLSYQTTLPGSANSSGQSSQRFDGARRCYEFY